MSDNFIEVAYDKFVFKADKGCLYHADECWARREGDMAVVGVTDFLQKTAGDAAFVELPEIGTHLSQRRRGRCGGNHQNDLDPHLAPLR